MGRGATAITTRRTPEELAEAQRRLTLVAAVLPEAIDLLTPAIA